MDIQRLREIFDRTGSFAIVVGDSYTIDEMGAALSLYLALTSQGRNVSVVSSKQPLVEVSNLVGIDKVRSNYESGSGDLIVSFPYQGDEIGKVSYTLEAGYLNIIVKPKENSLSFGERDVAFRRSGDVPTVLITVGVKRLSELSSIFNVESLKDTTIVNIDKDGANEGFGDIVVIGQGASSVSEQVANILLTLAYPLDPDISQNLMSGIVQSTQDFQSSITSSLAFEMAGILLRSGAVREGMKQQRVGTPRFSKAPSQFDQLDTLSSTPATPPRVTQRQAPPKQIREFPREQTRSASSGQAKDEAPPDWLSPKIYKGSTNVE